MHFNMNRNRILKLAGFLLLALALFSCTDTNLAPVFYALEQEKPLIDDRGFPDDAVVQRLVQNGLGGRYFAAAGNLYWRDANSASNWSRIAPPVSGALCTNVEIFSSQLVAAYFTSGNTGLGLWQRKPDLSDSWAQVSDATLPANANVGLLKTVGGNLFVSTYDGSYYNLYFATTITPLSDFLPTGLPAVTSGNGPITDIESDGTNYWVSVGKTLYWDNGGGLSNLTPYTGVLVPTATTALGGLYYSTTSTSLYLAGDNGKVFRRIGGDWEESSVIKVDNKAVSFTVFAELAGLTGDIYAGTSINGYYSIPGGDIHGTFTRSPSYTISDLYDGAILSMLYDGSTSPPSLLLGTYNSGLWRGDWTGSTWAWKQE